MAVRTMEELLRNLGSRLTRVERRLAIAPRAATPFDPTSIVDDVNDFTTPLGRAVRAAGVESVVIPIGAFAPGDNRPAAIGPWSPSANQSGASPAAYFEPGVNSQIGAVVSLPYGWNNGRISLYWSHKTGGAAGNVRWLTFARPFLPGTPLDTSPSATEVLASVNYGDQSVLRTDVNAALESSLATGGTLVQVGIIRNGSSTEDSFTGQIGLLAVVLERTA